MKDINYTIRWSTIYKCYKNNYVYTSYKRLLVIKSRIVTIKIDIYMVIIKLL
jgi:hypothetical protein